MSNQRKWSYDMQTIATASKQKIEAVRDHRQGRTYPNGGILPPKFDPDSFESVCRYVVSRLLDKEARP